MQLRSKKQLVAPPPNENDQQRNPERRPKSPENQAPSQNNQPTIPHSTLNDKAVDLLTQLFENVNSKVAYTRALNKFIERNETYSKFKPIRQKFPRRKTKVHGPFNTYQIDLSDYQKFKYRNRHYGWILFIIDAFSRYGYCIPLKTKSGPNTVAALEKWLLSLNHFPKFIYSDAGTEFTSTRAKNLFRSRGISHFILGGQHKAAIVERFQRTIKTNLEMYFHRNHTKRWIDVIQSIVKNYNSRYHRSIGMAPADINYNNYEKVYKRLYPISTRNKLCKLSPGDLVRIAIKKKEFSKGYHQTFSNEIYKVLKAIDYDGVCQYEVQDVKGGAILRKYYQELSLVARHDSNTARRTNVQRRRALSA